LKATIYKQKDKNITVPHSKEWIEELKKVWMHCANFLATVGAHLTVDDFFIA
jgi:hypothetical protein